MTITTTEFPCIVQPTCPNKTECGSCAANEPPKKKDATALLCSQPKCKWGPFPPVASRVATGDDGAKRPYCGFESQRCTKDLTSRNIEAIAILFSNIWRFNSKVATLWKPSMSGSASNASRIKKPNDSKDESVETEIEKPSKQETRQRGSNRCKSVVSVDSAVKRLVVQTVENSFAGFSKVYDLYIRRIEDELDGLDRRLHELEQSRKKLEAFVNSCMNTSNRIEDLLATTVHSRYRENDKNGYKGLTASVDGNEDCSRPVFRLEERIERLETELSNFHKSEESGEREKIDMACSTTYENRLKTLEQNAESMFQDSSASIEKQCNINEKLEQSLRKLDNVANTAESVKQFVERNIRIRSDAESLVKEQVSLITKQVCIEMRSVTSRSLDTLNSKIGKLLKRNTEDYENDLEIHFHDGI